MNTQKACCYVSFVTLSIAAGVAWGAELNGWPQTVMDPVGQVVGAFELVALIAIVVGGIFEWRHGHGK